MTILIPTKHGNFEVRQHDDLRIEYVAGAAIDADGANSLPKAAYMVGDKGSDFLANGGMKMVGGQVRFSAQWGKDVVIHENGQPKVFPGGVIASKTAYKEPGMSANDPAAYVDSERVPYIAIPPQIRQKTKGVVMGARCTMEDNLTGVKTEGVVADIGPRTSLGELSIAAARALGLNPSPKNGGTEIRRIRYLIFPNEPAVVNGRTFSLIPA